MHYPQKARCRTCAKRLFKCQLPFHTMPVHRRDGADATVICTEYVPGAGEVGKPFLNPQRGRRL